ncbi:MAG: biotin--[acetyl-CoA-carboxylase] ligase [Isosphaeraceae bacterium]|nr:biotin--[acetyl-CoA-carboxylase] ligase [Isosphaeraceae bacterium]
MVLPFVRTVIHREVVGSTSDLARELVQAGGVELPLLGRADRQTAGRGRGSNSWWSDEGSLLFTLALDPRAHGLRTEHEPRLALAAAVAVIEALEEAGSVPAGMLGLRWPNDIEAAGRKLGGLLPERVETDAGPRLLLGIGLNVATRLEAAPEPIRRMATSVAALAGRSEIEATMLLGPILARLEGVISRLARDDPGLVAQWNALDTLAGGPVRVDLGGRLITGLGQGIDPRGGLILATEGGLLHLYGGRVLRE